MKWLTCSYGYSGRSQRSQRKNEVSSFTSLGNRECAHLRPLEEGQRSQRTNPPRWVAKDSGYPWRIAVPTPGRAGGRTYSPARWAGMTRWRPQEGRSRPTGPAVAPRQSRPHLPRVEARAAMSSVVIRFMARASAVRRFAARASSTASMLTILTSRASTSMP